MHQIADSMTAENVKQIPKVTFLWQTIYILSVTEANDFLDTFTHQHPGAYSSEIRKNKVINNSFEYDLV